MMDGNFPTHMSKEDRTKVLNFKISIQNVKGVHAFPFKAKKPFFVPRIRETGGTEEENIISKLYKISSIIILPLILNHEIIGTVDLSSEKKNEIIQSRHYKTFDSRRAVSRHYPRIEFIKAGAGRKRKGFDVKN